MQDFLSKLLAALGQSCDRAAEIQTVLTSCQTIGPDNGGEGEISAINAISQWLAQANIGDTMRIDAPDPRVPSGIRPNLVARIPGTDSRTLWLFGHVDVVPPGDLSAWDSDPWILRREGDMVYGRGVEDNQQAVTSMLLLAGEIARQGITPPMGLGLVFMADEECGSAYGLDHVLKQAPELFGPDDLLIVPDAGNPDADSIEIAEKCQLWVKVEVIGQQCHASTPDKGRNAFVAAADMALLCHHALYQAFPARNELFDPPHSTFVPTRHDANVPSINILPGKDAFWLDCRLIPEVSMQAVLDRIDDMAREMGDRHQVRITATVEQAQPASLTPATSPVVGALQRAVQAVYGITPRPVGIGGATVASFLRHKGLPTVVWSCIQNTCHQPNECSSLSATCKDSQVFAHILMHGQDHA